MASKSLLQKFIIGFLSIFGTLVLLLLVYAIFIVKVGPVNSNKSNSVEVVGIVDKIYEGGVKDLVFSLKEDDNIYYINRALENGFDLKTVENELLNKKINIWYAKHRSRPKGGGHMMQLQYQDSIYYTEWEIPLASTN